MGENDTLSARQRRGVAAILSAPTMRQAASDAGVSHKTLYRWLTVPAFREALALAQTEAVRMATVRLTALLSQALEVVGDDLGGNDAKLRFRAAAVVLSHFAALAEYVDLVRRVEALEQNKQGVNDGKS